jgi:hypothetical protein
MPWNRGARVSKEDHRAAAEHVLRPGEAQRARAGAGDAGGTRGGSSGGGATWRGEERASGGRGSGGGDAGAARGVRKAARRRRVHGTWPARAAGAAQRRNGGAEGWR